MSGYAINAMGGARAIVSEDELELGEVFSKNLPAPATDPNAAILANILELEATVTPRRVREALLSGDTTFIRGVDAAVSALRAQLQEG